MVVKRAMGIAFVLALATSMVSIVVANNNFNSTVAANWNPSKYNFWGGHRWGHLPQPPKRILVGGSTWRFGFNYTDWAIKNGPFYMNDLLVFKYDPPNSTAFPHSVYLLPDYWSFQNCDLRWARKIGEVDAGGGQGFEFVLRRWQPYYFACGEHNGSHCNAGLMKFAVWPLIRWFY